VFVSKGPQGVRVAVTGAGAGVFRAKDLEAKLAANWSAAALNGATVSADGLNSDLHGSAEYRAALIPVLAGAPSAAASCSILETPQSLRRFSFEAPMSDLPAQHRRHGGALLAHDYVADRQLATVVYLALKLQRPLFLEGEPGTGKTEIARTLATMLAAADPAAVLRRAWTWPAPPTNGTTAAR
jgi:hypothetical protein